ncbi:MAG: ACT domain-containing protein [Nanoarchaeota archaeon]|nr:ACT domain-containing protein [Nanoarchaeota archaeon]MBU1501329.1 ACT domain-containing protein [Nanoarchaeota archaeon]MBU2459400.1 ACT domain-containing protein [Nanoarchaeota archaeon]
MEEKLIKVWDEDFDIIKSRKSYDGAFANITNGDEITVIIGKNKINQEDILDIEGGWKLITFNTILDFSLTGFISKISSVLAEENISIFVISSYSTDHVLVKKENLDKALVVLKNLEIDIK